MRDSPTFKLMKVHVLFSFSKSRVSSLTLHKLFSTVPNISQVRFGSTIDWNCPEFSPHTQVLSNYGHQCHAGYVDEPPGEGSWKVRIIDPAADHVEEVYGDGEVQALLPPADEEPQTKGTGKRVQDECHHREPALQWRKTERFIAKDLVQWPTTLHKAVDSSHPQAQEAVVDALHKHNLGHNEDWVPDVATEVAGHCWPTLHVQAQRMLTTGPDQLVHPVWPECELQTWILDWTDSRGVVITIILSFLQVFQTLLLPNRAL